MKNFICTKVQFQKRIHPEFKQLIKETRSIFLDTQQRLSEEEGKAGLDALIEKYYPTLEKAQERLLVETDRMAHGFSDEEHLVHKDFLRDELGILFWSAPLHERSLKKPLGYAGDYEMMNILYDENPFKGPTTYFRMINALGCRCISGRATSARIPYFLKKFDSTGKDILKRKSSFCVLNLACGPSREVLDFIRLNPLSQQMEIHLIDQDSGAIHSSRKNLENIKEKLNHTVRCFFYERPIAELLFDQTMQWPSFDLIYSGGLFDYLDDDDAKTLLDRLLVLLDANGTMVIGNLSPNDYSKTVKWYLNDWPLIYRAKEDLLKLVPLSLKPQSVTIESEETGVNLFLVIKK